MARLNYRDAGPMDTGIDQPGGAAGMGPVGAESMPPVDMGAESAFAPEGLGAPSPLEMGPQVPGPTDVSGRSQDQQDLIRAAMQKYFQETFLPVIHQLYPETSQLGYESFQTSSDPGGALAGGGAGFESGPRGGVGPGSGAGASFGGGGGGAGLSIT